LGWTFFVARFFVPCFFGTGSWLNQTSKQRVTNRATRTRWVLGRRYAAPVRSTLRAIFFTFLRATSFICGVSKASLKIDGCWFGKRYLSDFAKHAGASLFWHKSNPEFRCRPLASNYASVSALSGQPANMRRPNAASTESVFEKLG